MSTHVHLTELGNEFLNRLLNMSSLTPSQTLNLSILLTIDSLGEPRLQDLMFDLFRITRKTPQTLNRILSRFERRGLIEFDREEMPTTLPLLPEPSTRIITEGPNVAFESLFIPPLERKFPRESIPMFQMIFLRRN
jgi:DNA-binding PadR family transcriptional regulator